MPHTIVSKAVKRFKKLGHEGDRRRRARKRIVNVCRNRHLIKKRVSRNHWMSIRKKTNQTLIGLESDRLIGKHVLKFHPCYLKRAQFFTDENKRIRIERYSKLLRRANFTLGKNLDLYFLAKIYSWYSNRTIIHQRQKIKSVMLRAGICATNKTLSFINSGLNNVYRIEFLKNVVLHSAQKHFTNGFRLFIKILIEQNSHWTGIIIIFQTSIRFKKSAYSCVLISWITVSDRI